MSHSIPSIDQLTLHSEIPDNSRYSNISRPSQPLNFITKILFLPDLAEIIFRFVCSKPSEAGQLAQVCSNFDRQITFKCNRLWEQLARLRWPRIPLKLAPTRSNWYLFYRKRLFTLQREKAKLKEKMKNSNFKINEEELISSEIPIENCDFGLIIPGLNAENESKMILAMNQQDEKNENFEWKFKCPISSNKLMKTKDLLVDYCRICKKNVYWVKDFKQFNEKVKAGNCVAFSSKLINSRGTPARINPPIKVLRGEIMVNPKTNKK